MKATQAAGVLAEAGVARLWLHAPGRPPRAMDARSTDLPAVLNEMPADATVRDDAGIVVVRVANDPAHPGSTARTTDRQFSIERPGGGEPLA
ncbi:MAG: hypothetical protein AAFX79_06710 [Planctomycetota bacterium]